MHSWILEVGSLLKFVHRCRIFSSVGYLGVPLSMRQSMCGLVAAGNLLVDEGPAEQPLQTTAKLSPPPGDVGCEVAFVLDPSCAVQVIKGEGERRMPKSAVDNHIEASSSFPRHISSARNPPCQQNSVICSAKAGHTWVLISQHVLPGG